MSELSKLIGKGKKVKLGVIEIEIKPLTVSSMPLLMQMGGEDKSAQAEAIKGLIARTLKDSMPDATDEEIDKIPLEYMTKLMEVIMEVNKLESTDKDFLAKIKQRQSGSPPATGNTKAK